MSVWKNRPNGKTIRRNKIDGQFSPHTIDMIRSPAWRALSLSARRILDRLEIELADHGGADNGKLPATYENFVRYGIDRHAIAPAIREAAALGFLKVTEAGRGGNAEFRQPNLFRLTYRHTEVAPTNEWARITEDDAQAIARGARSTPRRQKQKTGGGKYRVSMGETHTENARKPMGETPTYSSRWGEPPRLSISRGGGQARICAFCCCPFCQGLRQHEQRKAKMTNGETKMKMDNDEDEALCIADAIFMSALEDEDDDLTKEQADRLYERCLAEAYRMVVDEDYAEEVSRGVGRDPF